MRVELCFYKVLRHDRAIGAFVPAYVLVSSLAERSWHVWPPRRACGSRGRGRGGSRPPPAGRGRGPQRRGRGGAMEVALAIKGGGVAEGCHAADVGGAETGDEEPDEALVDDSAAEDPSVVVDAAYEARSSS